MKLKSIIFPAAALTVICLVVSVALAFTYSLTEDRIREQERTNEQSILGQLMENAEFEELDEQVDGVDKIFVGKSASGTVGYVFRTAAKGYGGDVVLMTGVDISGRITGVRILGCEETPGLGKRAEEPGFLNQYEGLDGRVKLVKGSAGDGEVSAITSATITSTAVTEAVNQALDAFNTIKGEN